MGVEALPEVEEKLQRTRTFRDSPYLIFTNASFSKASHMTRHSVSVEGDHLKEWIHGRKATFVGGSY